MGSRSRNLPKVWGDTEGSEKSVRPTLGLPAPASKRSGRRRHSGGKRRTRSSAVAPGDPGGNHATAGHAHSRAAAVRVGQAATISIGAGAGKRGGASRRAAVPLGPRGTGADGSD